jgi:hypothetical protein
MIAQYSVQSTGDVCACVSSMSAHVGIIDGTQWHTVTVLATHRCIEYDKHVHHALQLPMCVLLPMCVYCL